MPKRLIDRCQPDCIREFRLAAEERFQDGIELAGAGRRTAAIYLWGYSAEATLKAAYFRANGFKVDRAIPLRGCRATLTNHKECQCRELDSCRNKQSGFGTRVC